jgi:DNA-binding response OmpR family regulator
MTTSPEMDPSLGVSKMTAKILVLDDDESVRNLLATFLRSEGHRFDLAASLGKARDLVDSNDYGIMLIDKNMLGIDGSGEGGMDFLRYVSSKGLSSQVIMMTGYATIKTAIEAMKLGAFDYIQKPFSLEDLRHKIKRILEYGTFINPDYTIDIYKGIQREILKLIDDRASMSDNELDSSLLSLNEKIDQLFKTLKANEKVILSQRESLANISSLAEQLKMEISDGNIPQDLIENICRRAGNHL